MPHEKKPNMPKMKAAYRVSFGDPPCPPPRMRNATGSIVSSYMSEAGVVVFYQVAMVDFQTRIMI
jgi:hypothetical protein